MRPVESPESGLEVAEFSLEIGQVKGSYSQAHRVVLTSRNPGETECSLYELHWARHGVAHHARAIANMPMSKDDNVMSLRAVIVYRSWVSAGCKTAKACLTTVWQSGRIPGQARPGLGRLTFKAASRRLCLVSVERHLYVQYMYIAANLWFFGRDCHCRSSHKLGSVSVRSRPTTSGCAPNDTLG